MSFTFFSTDSHKKIYLHEGWKLSSSGLSDINIKDIEATVPGCVHLDLMNNDLLDDPFYSMNELDVKWVADEDWIYETEIDVQLNRNSNARNQLVFEGLDTVADIYLDDELLGSTDNMFVSHRFDLPQTLIDGIHKLKICFSSPVRVMNERVSKWGPVPSSLDDDRGWVRKAQYSYGWDWGPILPTSGIWRPVYFQSWEQGCIAWYNHDFRLKDSSGYLDLKIAYTSESNDNPAITTKLNMNGKQFESSSSDFELNSQGERIVHIEFSIPEPDLWWPHDIGIPNLCDLEIVLHKGTQVFHSINDRIGLREVKLIEEKDEWGRSFKFAINGREVFSKGANWIPTDSFIPRAAPDRYFRQVELAKEANMNMLRIWGGGIYEDDAFYRAADELGIMIWQDFPYACALYPDTPEFLLAVREESRKAIQQISKHPSIVFWCGNNEIERDSKEFQRRWNTRYLGEIIWKQVIPEVLKEEFPSGIYRQSSPDGPDGPNSPKSGDRHVWNVWSGWEEEECYLNEKGRFVSEFGFQSPPDPRTIKKVLPEASRQPQSKEFEWHNKQINGPERLFRFMAGKHKVTDDFFDFIRKSQDVQASALQRAVEHWRRLRPEMMGSIIWQLNDCWPVSSWSLIDYKLRPKASFYQVQRAFDPKMLTLIKNDSFLEVWAVNESNDPWEDEVSLKSLHLNGELLKEEIIPFHLDMDTSRLIYKIPLASWITDEYNQLILAESNVDIKFTRSIWYAKPAKHMNFQHPEVDMIIEDTGIRLKSNNLALSIWLFDSDNPDLYFEDNALNLIPGEDRWIATRDIKTGKSKTVKSLKYWSFV